MTKQRRTHVAAAAISFLPAGQLQARLVSAAEEEEARELIERYEQLMSEWERLAQSACVLLAQRASRRDHLR